MLQSCNWKIQRPQMTEIKLYKSPWKALQLPLLATPFMAAAIWSFSKGDNSFINWLVIVFFGLGYVVGFFHLFDRRAQIVINENGIWDRTTNQDEIKWEQIMIAYPFSIHSQKFVSLKVGKEFRFKKKIYWWARMLNRMVGAQDLNLYLGQIKIDEIKFAEFIQKMSKSEMPIRKHLIESFFVKPIT